MKGGETLAKTLSLTDGPRRDIRLWIGDLRLQARTAYTLFDDHTLARRCVALFAGLPWDEDGRVAGCVYEKPEPLRGGPYTLDYSLIFGLTLYVYAKHTEDLTLAALAWPMAVRQLEIAARNLDQDWVYADDGQRWIFVDW